MHPTNFPIFFATGGPDLLHHCWSQVIARLRSCSDLTQNHILCKIDLRNWGKDSRFGAACIAGLLIVGPEFDTLDSRAVWSGGVWRINPL